MTADGCCVYCGDSADTQDHYVVPQSFRPNRETLPACRDCNNRLSNLMLGDVYQRGLYIHRALKKRFRKLVSAPAWTQEELDDLGPTLRSEILKTQAQRVSAQARIDWSARYEPGPGFVWGVDVGVRRVSIAAVGPDNEFLLRSLAVEKSPSVPANLSALRKQAIEMAQELVIDAPPLYVWVEQIAVFHDRIASGLYFAVGVVLAGLYAGLEDHYPFPVTVDSLPVATWKKHAVGYGAAKKAEVFEWARRFGYDGASQDEADALGIAVAGRKLLEPRPEQLALAR